MSSRNDDLFLDAPPRKKTDRHRVRRPTPELTKPEPDRIVETFCPRCKAERSAWLSRYPGRPAVCMTCRKPIFDVEPEPVITHLPPKRRQPVRP